MRRTEVVTRSLMPMRWGQGRAGHRSHPVVSCLHPGIRLQGSPCSLSVSPMDLGTPPTFLSYQCVGGGTEGKVIVQWAQSLSFAK